MRWLLGLVAGAVVAALSGAILGEYEMRGAGALVAAALLGVVVAEVVGVAGRSTDWPAVVGAAVLAAAGLWLARSIQWRFADVPTEVDLGVVVGAVVAGAWLRTSRGRGRDSRPA